MAVSSVDTLTGPYTTNGVTTAFPFTFKAMAEGEVRVFRVASSGVETTIDPGAYDVALGEDGGSVVFTVAPAAGDPLYIGTDPDFTQQITFENQGAFLPEVMNEAFDRAATRDIALKAAVDRSIRFPLGEGVVELPSAAIRAGGALGFDGDGGLVIYPQSPEVGDGYLDYPFVLTDGTTTIEEDGIVGIPFSLFINGIELHSEDGDYSIDGAVITLSDPGSDGDTGFIRVQKPATMLQARPENIQWKRTGLTAAQYRTLSAKSADRFDFRDMLGADLLGNNDMASTLSAALANSRSTGDILHMPLGEPVLGSTITLKSGDRISGVGARTTFPDRLRGTGSWFKIGHDGIGFSVNEDGFQSNIVIEQLGLFWDQPVFGSGWEPYDNDFAIVSTGARMLLRDLTLLNPTRGIRQLAGSGQIEICRVKGQPFEIGVQIDSGYEGFTVNGLRWWPFWSNDADYTRPYTLANRRGMVLRHIDNPYINGYFDIFSQFPLFFGSHANGVTNNANFVNPEFDNFGGTAVYVEGGANGMHATLNLGYSYGYEGSGNGVLMNANNGTLNFIGHRWQEINDHAALLQGTGNTLVAVNPKVTNWNKNNLAAEAFAGAAGNKIILEGDVRRSGGNGASIQNSVNVVACEDYATVSSLAVSAQTGAITTAAASCRVQRTGQRLAGRFTVAVTTNGTGAGDLRVAVPVNAAPGISFYSSGRNVTTGDQVQVVVNGGTAIITTPSNTYPIASGQTIEFNVDYEAVPL